MKKNILLFFIVFYSIAGFTQSFNYQAVIKDNSGGLVTNQTIGIRIGILENGVAGTLLYTETHTVATNEYGAVALAIGTGTTTDNFSSINWSTQNHWLEIAIDLSGGNTYSVVGTTKILSVPYAMVAKNVEEGDNLGSHTATQNVNLNNNAIEAVEKITTNTLIANNGNAVNNTSLSGNENIVIPGVTSDYNISVQDGNGRVQHKWNATTGTGETFITGGEDAAFIDINANVVTDNEAWIEFKHADGASQSAGNPINWNTHMIINQGGEIGINEISPDDRLHITDGGNGTRVRVENTSNGWAGLVAKNTVREVFFGIQGSFDANPGDFHIYDNTAGERRMVIDAAGNVGIGRDNPSVKLDVNGSVNCTGGTCSSDIRWKKEVKGISNVLANIKKMRGVTYFWRTEEFSDKDFTKDKQIGVIAQEVEKVYPELVKTDIKGYKSMDYMSLTAVLLEGIKEQQDEIEKLKKESSKIKDLESRLKMLERIIRNKN